MKDFNKLMSENSYKKYLLYIQIEMCKNKSHLFNNLKKIGLISDYEEYKSYIFELLNETKPINEICKQFDFTQKIEKEPFKLEKKFMVMKFVQNELEKPKINKQKTEQLTLGL